MKLSTPSFRGMAPRLTPRALPENGSQRAINARLLTGDLEAWKRPALVQALENAGVVRSIFLLDDVWLSYTEDVEFARGPVLGDETFRTYITGLDKPRFTNYDLATGTGSPPYPGDTRLLGVPAPGSEPQVSVQGVAEDANAIDITNPGAESGTTGWTSDTGALSSLTTADVPGLTPYAGNRFFSSSATDTSASQELSAGDVQLVAGAKFTVTWQQARGPAGSLARMGVQFLDQDDVVITTAYADWAAANDLYTWEQRTLTAVAPRGTARVRLLQEYDLVGTGTTDAYIDAITMVAGGVSISWDGSSLDDWTTSPSTTEGQGGGRLVQIASGVGNPAPSINMDGDENCPFITRDFQADQSRGFSLAYDLSYNSGALRDLRQLRCGVLIDADGSGAHLCVLPNSNRVVWASVSNNSQPLDAVLAELAPTGAWNAINQWLRISIDVTINADQTATAVVTMTNAATGAVYIDAQSTSIPMRAGHISFSHFAWAWGNDSYWDNITYSAAPVVSNEDDVDLATSYVYTFVNDLGEESAPSDASTTILRGVDASVLVTTATAPPTGLDEYFIETKRIYRAVTGALGSVYRFVAEIPLATADYTDTIPDSQLGEELESTDWDLPPDDLRYILALPNGIMVGASKNQLCFSVRNRPHAWPVAWRLPTDSDITGLANVDTSVVVGTETFVYTASGNDPSAYSMSKPGAPHACLSARSMAYLLGIGAVFAGPDGLMAVNGPTSVVNLTEGVFTREQWQALDPSTITGIAHDDTYFLFCTPVGSEPVPTPDDAPMSFTGSAQLTVDTPNLNSMIGALGWEIGPGVFLYDAAAAAFVNTTPHTAVPVSNTFNPGGPGNERAVSYGSSNLPMLSQIDSETVETSSYWDGEALVPIVFTFPESVGINRRYFSRRSDFVHFVASFPAQDTIYRFSATTGAFVTSATTGQTTNPSSIADTGAAIYVLIDDVIRQYNRTTLAFEQTVTGPGSQISLVTSDAAGNLYAYQGGALRRLDGSSWTVVATLPESVGANVPNQAPIVTDQNTTTAVIFDSGSNINDFYQQNDPSDGGAGYALDMKRNGFGLIELGLHASAVAQDFASDALCMVLDEYSEPVGTLLPNQTGAEIDADGLTIYEWNAATGAMRYSWQGKLWLNPHPLAWHWVRVRAEDYDDLEITFTADGTTLLTKLVTSNRAFRLPVRRDYNEVEWTAIGTSRVRSVELADDVMELA